MCDNYEKNTIYATAVADGPRADASPGNRDAERPCGLDARRGEKRV